VQTAVISLLFLIVVAAFGWFAMRGLRQMRRARALARRAHGAGMRFSVSDPFDVPRRYADFVLMAGGHSPRAHNVTYGRLDGQPVRAFDFRYEIGHGTRRTTRHYSVVVAELDHELPDVLLWHVRDEAPPSGAADARQSLGCWAQRGDEALATKLAGACRPLGERVVSLQTHGERLMLALPVRKARRDYALRVSEAGAVLDALHAPRAEPNVENRPHP